MQNKKLQGYTQNSMRERVAGADPYQIIQMLMSGVIDSLNYAKGAIQQKNFELKAQQIAKASAIIESLRSSLRSDIGAEATANLNDLYLYMYDRLVDATANNDVEIIDEVVALMREIKTGWDAIPVAAREEAFVKMQPAAASGA